MVILVLLVFPLLLLVFLLLMERVERPLRVDAVGAELDTFLETARPEEVETFVSRGFAPALERYWRRRASAARRPVEQPGLRRRDRRREAGAWTRS